MLRSASHAAATTAKVLVVAAALASWAALPAVAAGLPDSRAYELVSPPDKNGGDVVADTQRTRAATDGSAVGFTSLAGFAALQGTGVSTDYLSVRSTDPRPGTSGWATHGVMPPLRPLTGRAIFAQLYPLYVGDYSPDLSKGLLFAWGSLGLESNVDGVANIFRNTALRSPGGGSYDLVSSCPLCARTGTALPDYPRTTSAIRLRPLVADASADLDHVAFESLEQLTVDTPAQPAPCDLSDPTVDCHAHVYEWDNGTVQLAGRVPTLPATECDDAGGPLCVSADVSLADEGTGASRNVNNRTPHAITAGVDGHVRVFFTQPTDVDGLTSDELGNSTDVNTALTGRIFMRVDGTSTVQLNTPERTTPDTAAPAQLLDAAPNGTRVFFMTTQALTNDAPADGQNKLYMYDTSKPASAPDNLSFISPDAEPADASEVRATIGVSDDGHYVYFVASGQLVRGLPTPASLFGIYLWHDGTISYVGSAPTATALQEDTTANGTDWGLTPDQARVTPDGRHLLFSTNSGDGLVPGYDHGGCLSTLGFGCRELYVYSADSGQLASCVSCNPSGVAATVMATDSLWSNAGAAPTTFHANHAISDDGSRVFFTTGEALVSGDTNGRLDAYEYDVPGRALHLLSSGTDTSDSYFLDASASGNDAFFATRERLVGWDTDSAYDLYDARVGGGFPEPVARVDCSGDTCQGDQGSPPAQGTAATTLFRGAGNVHERVRPRAARKRCRRGFVRKRVRGKVRCVKKRHHKSHHRAVVRSKRAQQTDRRGS